MDSAQLAGKRRESIDAELQLTPEDDGKEDDEEAKKKAQDEGYERK